MQALILAAGMGTRLNEYTDKVPKCMVPVNKTPLIERALHSLVKAGIKKVIIGLGYKGDVLKEFVTALNAKYNWGLDFHFIDNPVYDSTNNIYSLYLTKKEFVQDDTILLESDLIFDLDLIKSVAADSSPNLAVVSKFEPWMDGTCTTVDENDYITSLVDKSHFKYTQTDSYYKTVNIYKFSKDFIASQYLPFLESYMEVYGKNEYYETTLKILCNLNPALLKAFKVSGDLWYEIDDPADLNIADNRFAQSEEKLRLMQERNGGTWRFPSLLDFSTEANPFFPPQKIVEELSLSLKDLITKPTSSNYQKSILAAKLFKILPENIAVTDSLEQAGINPHETESLTIFGEDLGLFGNTAQAVLASGKKVFVAQELGKLLGVPGLGLTVIISSDKELIESLKENIPCTTVSSVAEYFLQILEKYKKECKDSLKKCAQETERLYEKLSSLFGQENVEKTSLAAVTVKTSRAVDIAEKLLSEYNCYVKSSGETLCVTTRTPENNELLFRALERCL